MAQPTAYNPAHEFLTDEGANPLFPGSELDIEFNALDTTIGEIRTNLALIQRADGDLANGSVGLDQMSDIVLALLGEAAALAALQADFDAVEANVALTAADADATAADRVQTGLDADATAADVVSTGLDADATAADRVQTGLDAVATAADVVLTGLDADATAADRVQTGLDVVATAALLDQFDDIYLGSKAADPTLDNDGNALAEGQLYWNSVANNLRVYDGAAWNAYSASAGDAVTTNPLSQFAATTSSQLAGVISDETGSGALVFGTSPTLTTPALGVATATSINGNTLTTGTYTLTGTAGKTLTFSNTLTLAGTDSTTMTFPSTSSTIKAAGKETIWIPASAMVAATTNGPATGTVERTTNKNMNKMLDFDTTTSEIAQFLVAFPKSWDLGTVTFIPHWTAASGSGTVIWALSGVAISNDDTLDVAFGTAQSSTDTLITAVDNHVGPESSAITIAGTPAALDLVNFKIVRDISDTLGVDARLIGIQIIFTTNAATDA